MKRPIQTLRDPTSMRVYLTSLVALAFLPLLGACPVSSPGEKMSLVFTPSECGGVIVNCAFEHQIAVGGTLTVQVMRDNGRSDPTSAEDLDLTLTSDSKNLKVESTHSFQGQRAWRLTGMATGPAVLSAKSATDSTMDDSLTVFVQQPNGLGLQHGLFIGNANGPGQDNNTWTFAINTHVQLQAVPFYNKAQLMGQLGPYIWNLTNVPGAQHTPDGLLDVTLSVAKPYTLSYSVVDLGIPIMANATLNVTM